jgi:hypothetical protein
VTGLPTSATELAEASRRASQTLGGPVQLAHMSMGWRYNPQASAGSFGADRPSFYSYSFYRRDLPADARSARVFYDAASQSGAPQVGVLSQGARPAIFPERVDLLEAFRRVEGAGGVDLHREWERLRRPWSADASTALIEGVTVVNVTYFAQDPSERIQFLYEVRTNTVKRL